MQNKSLSLRLALFAAGGSAFALILAGIVFLTLFQQSIERTFDSRLDALLRALIGASIDETMIDAEAANALGEPRFALPQSGWYWQIRDVGSGMVVAASPSLFGDALQVTSMPPDDGSIETLSFEGPDGRRLRALEQLITPASGSAYAVLVAGDADALAADVARFRIVLSFTLATFAVLLALATFILIRIGLRPLRDVRLALRAVRQGDTARLEGDFPSEIAPLVDDLNALLLSNREIVTRARTHVGNLAHALKTPLAVLQNEAKAEKSGNSDQGGLARKVGEQVTIMGDQIGHHLDRARMAAQTNVIGVVTPVEPVLGGLVRVMQKVYLERDLAISFDLDGQPEFRGEKHDLEEMAGNLLDNACKWAKTRVALRAAVSADARRLEISIEDDGPGLSEAERGAVLERGTRLDETKPGSGLGLSIVGELARTYGGALKLEAADMGGLNAVLILPAATDDTV